MKTFMFVLLYLFPSICLADLDPSFKEKHKLLLIREHLGYNFTPSSGAIKNLADKYFFYLDFDKEYYPPDGAYIPATYEINTTEKYGDSLMRDSISNCEIDREEPNSRSLICILDILENEFLYIQDETSEVHIPLTLNVPKGMCDQLITTPAWHWNSKPEKASQSLDIGGLGRTNWNYYNEDCLHFPVYLY